MDNHPDTHKNTPRAFTRGLKSSIKIGSMCLSILLAGCFDNSASLPVTLPEPVQPPSPTEPPAEPPSLTCESPQVPNATGDACMMPEPVVSAQPGEAIIFYNRPDAEYDGWVLHLWNNDACPNTVANPTTWPDGPSIAGIDPNYGGYFIIPLLEDYSNCMNFIVHDAAGVKDISQQDQLMDLTGSRMIWTLSGVDQLFTEPTIEVPVTLSGAAAHWVNPTTLVWNMDPSIASDVRLYHSMQGDLNFTESGIDSDSFIALSAGEAENDPAAVEINQPNWQAFHLELAPEQMTTMLRSQLIAIAYDDEGDVVGATRVQIPRLLDNLFTQGENDADEQTYGIQYVGENIEVATWAPTAQSVTLNVYDSNKALVQSEPMSYQANTGAWTATLSEDMDEHFYRFAVTLYHPVAGEVREINVTDPYSVSVSTNGRYSQFIDLNDDKLKPQGWDTHSIPEIANLEDAVIYEGHIRDFSILDPSVTPAHRGKYLAFTDENSVPMQHLKKLVDAGLNYFHVLPANDIASIDEDESSRVNLDDKVSDLCAVNAGAAICATHEGSETLMDVFASFDPASEDAQQLASDMRNFDSFNWGYDPHHFNTPDGSYATDAEGSTRIKEMRAMIMGLHNIGLRVALDVVYNHTNASGVSINSVLDKLVPGYYHRYNAVTGDIERSTCCENTATENRMMEKFMTDSLMMWAQHYKYDAFRFDLMGHVPKSAILAARDAVQSIDADNYFYGEGWDFGEVAGDRLFEQATQKNMANTEVGTFNDQIREAVRGAAMFSGNTATGTLNVQDKIRMSLAGTLVDYELMNANNAFVKASTLGAYAGDPADIINYVSKHDNETLWDQLNYTLPSDISLENRVRAQNISMGIPLLSQGIPFLQLGGDFLRSKSMDRNSFDAGDWFNRVDFSLQTSNWNIGLPSRQENQARYDEIVDILADANRAPSATDVQFAAAVFEELLRIRSSSKLFRLTTAQDIKNRIGFHNVGSNQASGLIVMSIDDGAGLEDIDPTVDAIVLMINATDAAITHNVPSATGFSLHPIQQNSVDANIQTAQFTANADGGEFTVPAYSLAVFVKNQGSAQGTGLSPFATIGEPDTAPYGDTTIYVRGTMNEWSTNDALNYQGEGVYQTRLSLNAETQYEFKVASEDWSTVNSGGTDGNANVMLNSAFSLVHNGANLTFTPTETGNYVFVVDASNTDAVTLTIRTEEPYPNSTILLRGTMNGWGETDAFDYIGAGKYEISMQLAAGDYEFKVATADWSTVNLGSDSALSAGSTVSLVDNGANITLSIATDGDYVFVFDAANPQNAFISVDQAGMFGDTTVFVRGTMNGWSTDNPMVFDGSHIYTAILTLAAGNYEFKFGSENWDVVDLGAGSNGNQLGFGNALQLAPSGGDIGFSIEQAGNYQFMLRGPSTTTPEVSITRQ
ncbi:alpha-1,6-glucosidase domain-containing protein [Alteromonas sp. a30]|uniref:alpha-1,6-glucosidase domain-containing protein n=1 Tax=Alteromonas sp. a30 TaxID=2730917 RepID=UPI0022800454|nr:alpha-1,6-glucosidase domain-containing protein [Alteromonas sp. a30]MCY7297040.1 DUF3372 domain-containing protein [Alteromonas sp. a30]